MQQIAKANRATHYQQDRAVAKSLEKRLMDFIKCDPANPKHAKRVMTGEQVHACLGLLKKYRPDLKSIEFKGDPDAVPLVRIERVIIDPKTADGPSLPAPTSAEPL